MTAKPFHFSKQFRTEQCDYCGRCFSECPVVQWPLEQAQTEIRSLVETGHSQVLELCTGCMACVAACPQDALVSDHDLDELLNSFHPGDEAVVSCFRRPQTHPDAIIIPCVGIFSQQMLAAMVLSDCRSVTFQMVGCAECPNRDAANRFIVNCLQITN